MGIRRFAPVWVLYTLGILLYAASQFSMRSHMSDIEGALYAVREMTRYFALFNAGYALVVAQLLFGDLYTARLSYAIRAMPVTRGGWFGTQIILALLGSFLPNLLAAGTMLFYLDSYRIVIVWWYAAVQMQFLFFFGAAVLCSVAAGNRLGMLALYAMLNFFGGAMVWAKVKIYASLIYAMYLPDQLSNFSPILPMVSNNIFDINYGHLDADGNPYFFPGEVKVQGVVMSGFIWQLALYAAVGIVLIAAAMCLFRRRRPECAGDLLAFRKSEPVFLVLFTLCAGFAGTLFAFVFNWQMKYLLLVLGLVGGYFICLMFLRRTMRVFTAKSVLGISVISGAVLLSLVLTGLDVFGITYRMPKEEDIASVCVMLPSGHSSLDSSDPENIRSALTLQRNALDEHRSMEKNRPVMTRIFGDEGERPEYFRDDGDYEFTSTMVLVYTMRDGTMFRRCYFVHESSPSVPILRDLLSREEVVFNQRKYLTREGEMSVDEFLKGIQMITVDCFHNMSEFDYMAHNYSLSTEEERTSFLEAIRADFAEGNMAQELVLHADSAEGNFDYLTIWFRTDGMEFPSTMDLRLFSDCTHAMNWLAENGIHEK